MTSENQDPAKKVLDMVERASKRSSKHDLFLRSTDPLFPTLGGYLDATYSNGTSGLDSHFMVSLSR